MAALHLAFPVTDSMCAESSRICGTSAMAEMVREFDWSRTALGPMREWPEGMMAAVNLMLASPIASTLYWGPELAMIYNDSYRLLMGARHPQALGRPGGEVWREAWHIVGPQFEETLRTGATVRQESLLVPIEQDGAMRDFYWNYSMSPVYDGGRIAGVYNTCTDVTASVVTAMERDGLARRLQHVLASTSDGAVIIDRNWCVTYMNAAALKVSTKIPGMLGRNLWASLPALVYEGSPNLYHFGRAMHEGIAAEFESYYPEPLNHWLCIKVAPTAEGIAVFFQDITEAKQSREEAAATAEALAASEEELRWTVALSAQMPWTADVAGEILWVDRRRGSLEEQPIERRGGDDWHRLVHPEDLETSIAVWDHAIRSGTAYDREQRLLTADGSYRWFRSRARPRRDATGAIVKWYGTTEDIHTRVQTQEALRTSEKLAVVGRLASSIAHEINNPLEAVTNLLFLARTSADVPAEVQKYLDTAEREMLRAATIVSHTLRFHRQSSKQTEVEFGGLIDEVLAVLHGKLVNSATKAEVRARTSRRICCFEGEIRQVLLNLAANAIDAMGVGGGRLLVRTREATDWRTGRRGQVVTVADTGVGMSAEVRARIFDAFFTTKGEAGTGLGLWVSQEIVARHKGVLRLRTRQAVEGRKGGSGCVFTLFLPEDAAERPRRRKADFQ